MENPDTYRSADVIFLHYAQIKEHLEEILKYKAEYSKIILLVDDTMPDTCEALFSSMICGTAKNEPF